MRQLISLRVPAAFLQPKNRQTSCDSRVRESPVPISSLILPIVFSPNSIPQIFMPERAQKISLRVHSFFMGQDQF